MFSPLLQSIIERHGYEVVRDDTLDAFAHDRGHVMLYFAGDADRLAESDDVAVVVPELHKAFRGAFTPAIVARDAEKVLQRRYRFNAFPCLVFLRDGDYLGAITRIQDWGDYLNEIAGILAREPSDPPAYKFPDGCAVPAADHHH